MNLFEAAEEDDPFGDLEDQGIDYHEMAEKQASEQSSQPQQPQSQMINTGPSMMSKQDMQKIKAMKMKMALNKAVNKVLAEEESKLDAKINKLSNMNEDDLEELRAKRLEQLKAKQIQRSKWLANDHGRIHEIVDQKQFFENVKSTKHVICLFYSKTSKWAHILQEHLTLIARKHLECKFMQIEALHAPFLIERLNIWMMPTLVLAKDNKVSTQLRGLDWCAPDGKIETIRLEAKLFEYGFLEETYLAIEKQMKKNDGAVANKTKKKQQMQQQDDDSEDDLFDD
eukprot:CAMPEP_0197021992 /NCGR_PEP_ID=MMETSP1384-20130603/2893_1 /TAXON_ID=29189 /ORGANISM="Ammonia sp." /LENGTH=283 /DNA_ID=CAMNT_0042449947 /DNA_START=102 /DNA_END=953 /DNA_ORIENTATION=-